jgi:hypothetical protein
MLAISFAPFLATGVIVSGLIGIAYLFNKIKTDAALAKMAIKDTFDLTQLNDEMKRLSANIKRYETDIGYKMFGAPKVVKDQYAADKKRLQEVIAQIKGIKAGTISPNGDFDATKYFNELKKLMDSLTEEPKKITLETILETVDPTIDALKRLQEAEQEILELEGDWTENWKDETQIEGLQKIEDAMQEIHDLGWDINDTFASIKTPIEEWGQTLIDNLSTAIAKGQDLGEVFKNLAAEIAAWFIKTKFLQPLLGPMFGLGGGGGGAASVGRAISPSGYANGGRYQAGVPRITGERGIELDIPDHSGTIIPNSDLKNLGGKMNVQINLNNQSSQPVKAQQNSYYDGDKYIVNVILQDFERNGPIRQRLGKGRA